MRGDTSKSTTGLLYLVRRTLIVAKTATQLRLFLSYQSSLFDISTKKFNALSKLRLLSSLLRW